MDEPRLLLPTFLHGPYAGVEKACRHAAARVAEGALLADIPDGWVDVADMAGYIVIDGPDLAVTGQVHYHAYALMNQLMSALDANTTDPRWDRIFDEILVHPWLIYCALGEDAQHLFRSPERARRFVRSVHEQWRTLNLPGRRFVTAAIPVAFWPLAHNLRICLGRLGADKEEVIRETFDPALQDGAMPPVLARYGAVASSRKP